MHFNAFTDTQCTFPTPPSLYKAPLFFSSNHQIRKPSLLSFLMFTCFLFLLISFSLYFFAKLSASAFYLSQMSSEASSSNNPPPPPPPPLPQNPVTHHFPCGTIIDLLKFEWAALILMEYDDQRSLEFVREGTFVVKLILQTVNPIFVAACIVGNHRWPITKDSPVIRFSPRTFVFGIPGVLYGLRLAPDCEEDKVNMLVRVFMDYADYEDVSQNISGIPWPDPESEQAFWPKSLPRIEAIIHSKLAAFGHIPGRSLSAVGDESPCLLRAIRLSSVIGLVSNVMLSGELNPAHTQIYNSKLRPSLHNYNEIHGQRAFPSMTLFTKIVDAVETILVIAAGDVRLLKTQYPVLAKPYRFKLWSFNKEGVAFLLKLSWEMEKAQDQNEDGSESDGSEEVDDSNNTHSGGSMRSQEIEYLISMTERW